MARMVHCAKLKKEAEGLDLPPYPGELGKKIYQSISKDVWTQWLDRQTMFINEYQLSMIDPKARKFLEEEMQKFLFSDDSKPPQGFVEEGSK